MIASSAAEVSSAGQKSNSLKADWPSSSGETPTVAAAIASRRRDAPSDASDATRRTSVPAPNTTIVQRNAWA